jgi:branched-subunit amino acid aminotransferase/4-amino-4-deoxychorismate lyase
MTKASLSGAPAQAPAQDERDVPELSRSEVFEVLDRLRRPYHADYLAMYSSFYGGIVREPALMLVPVDDHVVHRGDGVFETAKCIAGRLYQLGPHLERLAASAAAIALRLPAPVEEIARIVAATVRAGASPDCFVRILVTRGPGGFTPSPFECPASQLYVVAYRSAPYDEALFERGVSVVSSRIPVKPGIFANIKSCNYLPNVLMKKEAAERGAQYGLAVDERGFLAEGAAENFVLVSAAGELLFPRFERILHGITVSRVAELAPAHGLGEPGFVDLRLEDAFAAREMILLGTSFDALPVVELDGRPIGDGRPGAVFRRVREMLTRDIAANAQGSQPVFT